MSISPARTKEILDAFAGKKILVVGDIFLDRYIHGVVERLNPEAPVPILHAKWEEDATGGAGNVAKNAAMLGATASLIGIMGSDEVADTIERVSREEGYNPFIVRDKHVRTIVKKRYVVGSQQLLRVDYEELIEIRDETEEDMMKKIAEQASHADAIIVSDYAKGTISKTIAHALMAAMREKDIPMMVDAKPSRATYFTGATYMSPNRKEAHEFLGIAAHENGGKKADELASMVSSSFDTTVFLTLSDEGMYVKDKNGAGDHIPTMYISRDEVVDTSGCGDTAATAILLSMLAGATLSEAAEIGNAAGATVARKVGAVGITPQELLRTIEEHHA